MPVDAGTVTLLPEVVETDFWVPFTVYVKVYGAVPFAPVKVISGEAEFLQTVAPPEIVAVGKELT